MSAGFRAATTIGVESDGICAYRGRSAFICGPNNFYDVSAGKGRVFLDATRGQRTSAAGITADGIHAGSRNLIYDFHMPHAASAIPVDKANITRSGAAGGYCAACVYDTVI